VNLHFVLRFLNPTFKTNNFIQHPLNFLSAHVKAVYKWLSIFIYSNTAYMKKLFAISYFIFLISYSLFSQNIGIGTNSPSASALLDITAANKGILVPRVTNTQMNAIASPANGLLVYNTDSSCFAYRNATAWVFLKGNTTASNDWSTKGNAGTDTSKNFIGTTDNVDLIFKRNNVRAGFLSGISLNTSFGVGALNPGTTSAANSAFGYQALYSNISGPENTATGYRAMYSNIDGRYNTANGFAALYFNVSGWLNTAFGYRALFNNTGSTNTAVGSNAMFKNVSGYSNVAVGFEALYNSNNRSNLVAVGDSALYNNVDGSANTGIGSKSLFSNTDGNENTAVGFESLKNNTSGQQNTAVGNSALLNNSGSSNTAIGYKALFANVSGSSNTAIGETALSANNSYDNVAIGSEALARNIDGRENTAVGRWAGRINNGTGNVFLGHQAGRLETGSYKLYIEDGYNDGDVPPLVYGEFDSQLFRINGYTEVLSGNVSVPGLRVIKNYESGSTNVQAIYGENTVEDSWGIGVEGKGGRVGVQGQSQGTGIIATYTGVKGIADGSNQSTNLGLWGQASNSAITNKGVTGEASGSGSDNYGLYGAATGGGNTNYGVYGTATGGVLNYAGYFAGDVVTNGKLTITTSPGATGLNLAGSDAYAEMRVIRNTLNATDKDLYLGFGSPAGSSVHLYSDGSETVLAKGNLVGVGKTPLTSSDDSRLQVKQIGVQNGIGIESANNTNHWDFYVTGNAASDLRLYYNGSIKGTFDNVTGAYTSASDRRLKKDITIQQPVLHSVMQLQAYQYHYLDNQTTDRFSNGFMAQDVQKLFPDAVIESTLKNGETRLGINYQYFTVLAIKGLQEQQEIIQSLQKQVDAIKAEIPALTGKQQQQVQSQEYRITQLETLVNKLVEKER